MAYFPTSGQWGAAPYFQPQSTTSLYEQWAAEGNPLLRKKPAAAPQTNYGDTFMGSFNTILQSLMNPQQQTNSQGANAFSSYLSGKNPFTMTAPSNPYGAGTQNPTAQYTLDAMRSAVAPINVNTVDPSAVIRAQLPKIQEMQDQSFANAAARFGATGMGVSTPYAQALGDVSRKTSNDIAGLTEGYYYQSATDAAARQLQADLANRQNQLAVGGQWMGATESGLDRDLQAQMQSNQMFLDAAKAYGGFYDSGGQNTSALASLAGQLAGLYGTSMENQAQRSWQSGENQADRGYSQWELGQTQGFQGQQAQYERDLKLQLTKMGYDDATAQRLATQALQSQQLGFTGQENAADRALQQALLTQTQNYQGGQSAQDRALQQALLTQTQSFQGGQSAQDRALQQLLQSQQLGFQGQEGAAGRDLQTQLAQMGYTDAASQRALQQALATQGYAFQGGQNTQDRALQQLLAEMGYTSQTNLLGMQQGFQGQQSELDRMLQQTLQGQQLGSQQSLATQQAQLQRELAQMGYSDSQAQRLATQMLQSQQLGFQGEQAGLDRSQQLNVLGQQQGFQGQQSAYDRALQQMLQTQQLGSQQTLSTQQAQLQRELAQMGYTNEQAQRLATQMLQSQQLGFQGEQAGLDRTLQQYMQTQQLGSQQSMATQQAQLQRELASMGYSNEAAARLSQQLMQQGTQNFQGQQSGLDRALQLQLAQMGYANQQSLTGTSQSQALQLANLEAQLQKELAAMGYAANMGQNLWGSLGQTGQYNPLQMWSLTSGIGAYPWYAQ